MRSITMAVLLVVLGLSACNQDDAPTVQADKRMAMSEGFAGVRQAPAPAAADTRYLAYEHTMTVDIDEDDLDTAYQAVLDACNDDRANECTLLDASLSVGDNKSARIRLRIKPDGVKPILALAAGAGSIASTDKRTEDLSRTITDLDRRLAMLTTYRERLQALEKQAADDVESLIRVTSELTNVQSQIENLTGQANYQKQRVSTDIVNIVLTVDYNQSLLHPIGIALGNFLHNLAAGISNAITVIAYLLPWLILLLIAIAILRRSWRRRR